MAKLLLMSVLIANLVLPFRAAREPSARRGFRKLIVSLLLFNAFYLFAIVYILPRLG